MIIINFKNYKFGDDVLKLARLIEQHVPNAAVALSATDIRLVTGKTSLNVYAQHCDLSDERSTGFVSASSLRASGASGVILNHSEHPIKLDILKKTIEQCRKAKLLTLVCASSFDEAKKIVSLRPEMIAFEDPKIIGTGKSITQYESHEVKKFVNLLKNSGIVPICGAGVSNYRDVDEAYKLGCKGVLISSAIAKSKNPSSLLKELSAWNF
ncbi:MAG: triose-phosphate isomerase [Nanoarchaeota archaeon]